jgi:hypothetical protein
VIMKHVKVSFFIVIVFSCYDHFRVSSLDIDECILFGPCGHLCSNTEGSFQCSCMDGYRLEEDSLTCTGTMQLAKILPLFL